MFGNRLYAWNTMPMSRRFGGRRVTSSPPITICPVSGCRNPATQRNAVVLPQPLGPSSDTSSPWPERDVDAVQRLVAGEALAELFEFEVRHRPQGSWRINVIGRVPTEWRASGRPGGTPMRASITNTSAAPNVRKTEMIESAAAPYACEVPMNVM